MSKGMQYTRLGRTGLTVSRICLGCMTYGVPERGAHPWTLPEDQSRPLIRLAVERGINFFDTANSYSDGTSEEIVGRALHDFARRDEIVVATKVRFGARRAPNIGGLSRKGVERYNLDWEHAVRATGAAAARSALVAAPQRTASRNASSVPGSSWPEMVGRPARSMMWAPGSISQMTSNSSPRPSSSMDESETACGRAAFDSSLDDATSATTHWRRRTSTS